MSLIVCGISHKTAPVELREKLAVPTDRVGDLLLKLKTHADLSEAVILSTCNRFEVYARPQSNSTSSQSRLAQILCDVYGSQDVGASLYQHESGLAVRHLFRVASGLESLVIGESEVLGQVKSAYQFAHQQGATGKVTNVLFQRALFVGKAVRTQTSISEGASSIGSIAVQLAEKIFGKLNQHRVLLLGAGEMAEITARHLLSQKAGSICILNRTKSKADALAKNFNGESGSLEQLQSELHRADIVVCSTSAEKPLIVKSLVEPLMHERRSRSLYFIDIAVPRNVEPGVHEIENVYVYNIDDLQSIVDENMGQRKKEISQAESMVLKMAGEFEDWLKALSEGTTRALRHNLDHAE